MNSRITAINVRLPAELVNWLDTLVEKRLYKSRSEAIREQVRAYIQEKARQR